MDEILLAGDDREAELEEVCRLIENMGRLDIPVWCWSWMAKFSWAHLNRCPRLRRFTGLRLRPRSDAGGPGHDLRERGPQWTGTTSQGIPFR